MAHGRGSLSNEFVSNNNHKPTPGSCLFLAAHRNGRVPRVPELWRNASLPPPSGQWQEKSAAQHLENNAAKHADTVRRQAMPNTDFRIIRVLASLVQRDRLMSSRDAPVLPTACNTEEVGERLHFIRNASDKLQTPTRPLANY
jgi:hypothetical protein